MSNKLAEAVDPAPKVSQIDAESSRHSEDEKSGEEPADDLKKGLARKRKPTSFARSG